MSRHYTIFGGTGFIGSELASQIEERGNTVTRIGRNSWPLPGSELGQVIFCIGMTADFRRRLIETFELQALRLHEALTHYRYESFLYLSSSRVYDGASSTQEETPLLVHPARVDHIYNISKLAGESLCIAHENPCIRVARLSNVYGRTDNSNLFLTAVMRDAVTSGEVTIGQSPTSSKDYIGVEDAAALLIAISDNGKQRIYNVACGRNFTHRQLADILEQQGYRVQFKADGAIASFPQIDITRIACEFETPVLDPVARLPSVLNYLKTKAKV